MTSKENTVENIMSLSRVTSGSMNSPTDTVPEEHRQARHATDEICNQ